MSEFTSINSLDLSINNGCFSSDNEEILSSEENSSTISYQVALKKEIILKSKKIILQRKIYISFQTKKIQKAQINKKRFYLVQQKVQNIILK